MVARQSDALEQDTDPRLDVLSASPRVDPLHVVPSHEAMNA